ncbi:hypothetical protein Tco_0471258 [Tanacetum coccineum]
MFDEVHTRIDADYELAARMTQEEQKKYTIKERAKLLAEFFERRKKQLAAEKAEAIKNKPPTKTQLRNLMMTYLKNMDGYKHRSYATQKLPKKPKVMKSAKDVTEEEAAEYEKEKEELRSDGSSSYHGDTQAFLRRLTRQDLNDLYMLVQERFQDHPLEGHDLVHTLFMDGKPMKINMLVKKKYPLIKELLEKMLNLQLEAEEESTMAFELIKFIKSLLEE